MDNTKVLINANVFDAVEKSGDSFSNVLEKTYEGILADKRKANPKLAGLSATKIALLDAGIDGSSRIDKLFTTSTDELLYPAYITELIDSTVYDSDVTKYMVTNTSPIDGLVTKSPTLDLLSTANKAALKRTRVAEGADIPMGKISIGNKTTDLYKKAIGIEQTYESMRYTRIDIASIMLRAIAQDIVNQNIADIINTLEGGTVTTLVTTAEANTVTNAELFRAISDYVKTYGFAPTTIACADDMFNSIVGLTYNVNTVFGVNQKVVLEVPQLGNATIALIRGNVSQADGKNRCLLFNKDKSIVRYVANGSNVHDIQKQARNQTEFVTLSEISGYAAIVSSVGTIVSA